MEDRPMTEEFKKQVLSRYCSEVGPEKCILRFHCPFDLDTSEQNADACLSEISNPALYSPNTIRRWYGLPPLKEFKIKEDWE